MANPGISKSEIKATLAALKRSGWNQVFAATELGISHGAMVARVRNLRNRGHDVPVAAQAPRSTAPLRERQQYKAEKAAYADLEKQLFEAQERLAAVTALQTTDAVKIAPPARGKKRPAVAVALASDWHVEEDVEPEKINGRNEYSLDIANQRIDWWAQGVIWKLRHHMTSYEISTLLLFLMGDFASGYIHPELVETTSMQPPKALLFWKAKVVAAITLLLEALPDLKLRIPCVVGNHGRTTEKIRIATRVENSFEWLGYHMLAHHFANEKRVEFHIAAGSHAYADVWDWRVRATHGDDVRYQGGVGGLSIPLRKAVDAWNESSRADYTVFGHWHQHCDFGWAVGNGSLIGYSPYSQWIKARYEPPSQAFFLIDRERGKDYVSPIWVSTQGARK